MKIPQKLPVGAMPRAGHNLRTSIKNGLAAIMRRIPQDKLCECKYAVDWMIKNWPAKQVAKIYSYTGGFFEDKNLSDQIIYHNVAVVKTPEAYFIADPTYRQFDSSKSSLILETLPKEEELLRVLSKLYGGKWWNL